MTAHAKQGPVGNAPPTRLVEIRSYNLKPGTAAHFHRLVAERSVPLLQGQSVDVVAFGPSLHGDDSYYLIRAYTNLEHLHSSEDAFYASDEWRRGPRRAILDCIYSYVSVVIELESAIVDGLRRPRPMAMSILATAAQ